MLTVSLGLLAALGFGAADFAGGLAAKRLHTLAVTGAVALVGLIVLGTTSLLLQDEWSVEGAFWGAMSGVTGVAAIGLLYACLARGPMSILSPTTAVLSALVPMTYGLIRGEASRRGCTRHLDWLWWLWCWWALFQTNGRFVPHLQHS